jgi:AbiV family abortive infection protein
MSTSSFDAATLEGGIIKAINNAIALGIEAELLLRHNHYARSFVLAQTGVEEIAKGALYFHYFLEAMRSGPVQLDRVDKKWLRDHKSKYSIAFYVTSLAMTRLFGAGQTLQLKEDAGALVEARMKGLYIDYDEMAKAFVSPQDIVTEAMAQERLSMFRACFLYGRYDILCKRIDELTRLDPSNLSKMLHKIDTGLKSLQQNMTTHLGFGSGRRVYTASLISSTERKKNVSGIELGFSLAFDDSNGFRIHRGGVFTVDHI